MLSDADFTGVRPDRCGSYRANLNHARLWFANLRDATCRRFCAVICAESRVEVTRAELRDTDFDRASFGNTILVDVDPSKTRNLATAEHRLPSTIGLDTIYTSEGKIPESFLRGAGVPDNFIEYMKSLTGAALVQYSCFISYSTKDQAFADRLYANLQARGVRWFVYHDIQGGQKIHEQIDEAIRVYDKLLLVLSEASMSSSWVKTEVANARAREDQQKRQMLFLIAIVAFDRIKDWKLFDADRGTTTPARSESTSSRTSRTEAITIPTRKRSTGCAPRPESRGGCVGPGFNGVHDGWDLLRDADRLRHHVFHCLIPNHQRFQQQAALHGTVRYQFRHLLPVLWAECLPINSHIYAVEIGESPLQRRQNSSPAT